MEKNNNEDFVIVFKIMRHLRPLWPRPLNKWPKINKSHLIIMTNQYLKYEDFVINSFQDNEGNHTNIQEPCDLDLWPSDPKIYRGHLLVMTNKYVKYEDFVIVFKIISGNHFNI
jgi:hypothetical protein